jgi:subtilisin family serine protease
MTASKILLASLLALSSACTDSPVAPAALIEAQLTAAAESGSDSDVLINLREPELDARHDAAQRKAAIERLSSAVSAALGSEFRISHRYRNVPALAGRITARGVDRLRDDPTVAYVQLASGASGQLKEAVPSLGVDVARGAYGLDGRGVRVALLDTGVDLEHPDLQNAVVAQHCFTRGACPPWNTDEGTSAVDDHGHGTAVAGVIASRGVVGPAGFAPQAELVALKVMDRNNRGFQTEFVAALEWLLENQDELKVSVVNLSIGTDQLYDDATDCDRGEPALARAIRSLVDAGVTVVGATGNLGSTTQLPAPGCNTGVIAVGATYDADVGAQPANGLTFATAVGSGFAACRDASTQAGQVACYTNTPERLDVLAPGGPMLTLALGGGTTTKWGTSHSAAAISGVAALLRQCNPALTPADLARALIATGAPREDPKSGRSFPFVRVPEAVGVACPTLEPDAGSAMPMGGSSAGAAGRVGAPVAVDGGQSPGGDGTRRDATKLQERYTGPAPAATLNDQPVAAGSAASESRAGSEATEPGKTRGMREPEARRANTEGVSSCSVQRVAAGHARAPFWALGALWLVARMRRRRR